MLYTLEYMYIRTLLVADSHVLLALSHVKEIDSCLESKLKSLHSLESAVCEAVLRSTLSHHSHSVQEVYSLLASAADVIDEDRIRAFAQLSNASLNSSNSGTETVSEEASDELGMLSRRIASTFCSKNFLL